MPFTFNKNLLNYLSSCIVNDNDYSIYFNLRNGYKNLVPIPIGNIIQTNTEK